MSEAMRERRVADDVEIDERTVASLDVVVLRGPVRLDPSGEAEVERRGGREEGGEAEKVVVEVRERRAGEQGLIDEPRKSNKQGRPNSGTNNHSLCLCVYWRSANAATPRLSPTPRAGLDRRLLSLFSTQISGPCSSDCAR